MQTKIKINGNELSFNGKTAISSRMRIVLLEELQKSMPSAITESKLMQSLHIQSRHTLNQHISQLRKVLSEFDGVSLVTHSKYGYSLKINAEMNTPETELAPHEKRVVDERNSLSEKVDKLCSFLGTEVYKSLPPDEQDLLDEQYQYMFGYLKILDKRIAKFTN
jgi:DNA-binding winged helix-turn-helix (wHTH) protein